LFCVAAHCSGARSRVRSSSAARGKRDLVPVVGHVASISAGEFIHAVGVWITDRTHGLQFKADFLKTTPPTTAEGIEKYLGSGMVRGIGSPHRLGQITRSSDLPTGPKRSRLETEPSAIWCMSAKCVLG
jgi:hypothetical protein